MASIRSVRSVRESDEESDDEESLFVYSRLLRVPPTFFRKDAVSACLFTPTLHALATHGGIVHLCLPDATPIRTVRVHRSSVLQLDSDGHFVATASIDGTVVVAAVADASDTVQASFRRPVHAVALHPDYRHQRTYVSGGTAGEVVLSERGWLKSRADTVLAHTQSTILAVSWSALPGGESRVVWCNEDGITVYLAEQRAVLSRIPRTTGSPQADLFRPRIHAPKRGCAKAVVAWARTVYVVDLANGTLDERIDLPYVVSGALPYNSGQVNGGQMALLAVTDGVPELKLRDSRHETYADELERGNLGSNDFHLAAVESTLYIISANDAIVARERTPQDHVAWLVQRQRYFEAYHATQRIERQKLREKQTEDKVEDKEEGDKSIGDKQAGGKQVEEKVEVEDEELGVRLLGRMAAEQLLEKRNFGVAASVLADVLTDRADWLLWTTRFFSEGEHLVWGDVLPSRELGDVHSVALEHAVDEKDAARLDKWLQKWDSELYDSVKLASRLETAAKNDRAMTLVLADVLLRQGEYVPVVQALVRADSPRAFEVTRHFHLWNEPPILEIMDQVLTAGDGDGLGDYVTRLRELIGARAQIAPSKVVAQLARGQNDLLLFGYLNELGLVDETLLSEFADLMVRLYVRYDNHKLLGFLERSDAYDIRAALKLCQEHKLVSELVYLLGRLGQTREALALIVTEIKDYARATSFAATVERSQGPEVWDQLIDYCAVAPPLVLELLKRTEVSPARVLAAVPAHMKIRGLKPALCGVLSDQETGLALSNGTLAIVRSESQHWTQALRARRARGTVSLQRDVNEPLLLPDNIAVPEFSAPVYSFSAKIAHLRDLQRDGLIGA